MTTGYWEHRLIWLLAVAALSGCNGSVVFQPGHVTVRDSLGVILVESSGATWANGEEWSIDQEPEVEIGSVGGANEYTFGFVGDAVRLYDGRFLVLDEMAATLREFDPAGTFVKDWAQKGEGPGELATPVRLLRLPGDSVLVAEFMGTSSIFGPDGRFVRRFRLPVEAWSLRDSGRAAPTWSPFGIVGYLGPQYYLARLRGWVDRRSGPHPETVALAGLSEEGGGDTIAVLSTGTWEVRSEDQSTVLVDTHFAPRVLALAHDGRVYASSAAAFSYNIYAADGELEKIVRLASARTSVDDPLKDRWRAYQSQYWGRTLEPGVPPGRPQQAFERTPYPDSMPAFYEMRVDALGNVWGELPATEGWPGWSRHHLVFDLDGRCLGFVEMPRGLRVTEIGADYVMGVWKNESDVDFVRSYRLRRH